MIMIKGRYAKVLVQILVMYIFFIQVHEHGPCQELLAISHVTAVTIASKNLDYTLGILKIRVFFSFNIVHFAFTLKTLFVC